MFRLCLLAAFLAVSLAETCTEFASFNIQVLGKTKAKKQNVVDSLQEILKHYDMTVVQEIRDTSSFAIDTLFTAVSAGIFPDLCPSQAPLNYFVGPRLGRTNSKEQYGFIYRTDKFTKLENITYPDEGDRFEREPTIALFKINGCDIKFLVIICHVTPQDVPGEIDLLIDVYEYARKKFNVDNAIITGDMNAGCSYLNKGEREKSKILHDKTFLSLFSSESDSTVATSACPYDRMFIAGEELKNAIKPNTAEIYHFDTAQGLTNDEAKLVSDHYPVQVELCCPAK